MSVQRGTDTTPRVRQVPHDELSEGHCCRPSPTAADRNPAAGVALTFVPQARSDALRLLFKAMFFAECASLLYRALRAGRGRETPEQGIDKLTSGASSTITTPLERAAFLAAIVATTVLFLS